MTVIILLTDRIARSRDKDIDRNIQTIECSCFYETIIVFAFKVLKIQQ